MDKPSCYDCQHNRTQDTGDGWNEPSEQEFDCTKLEKDDDVATFWDKYDDIDVIIQQGAAECPAFLPWMIDNCFWKGCKTEMHLPLYQAKIYAYEKYSGEPIYFCSDDCKDAHIVAEAMEAAEKPYQDC